ncbi:MAG: SHD1 domain-containing protein [Pirellulaceae bacterium]
MSYTKFFFFQILVCSILVFAASSATAQFQKFEYQVGDRIEVNYFDECFEAEVTEILPGGRALRADFVDGSGRKMNWMFVSFNVRDLKGSKPKQPANSSDDENVSDDSESFRTWKSVDKQFSVIAKLVGVEDDSVKLLKEDGTTVTVKLDNLSQGDRDFVATAVPSNKSRGEKESSGEDDGGFGNPEAETFDADKKEADDEARKAFEMFRKNSEGKPNIDSERSDIGQDSNGSALSSESVVEPAVETTKSKPALKQTAATKTQSLFLWKLIAFGLLFPSGIVMFILGFVNSKRYW